MGRVLTTPHNKGLHLRIPRWLVVQLRLVSVLTVLAGAIACWITWPKRTQDEFLRRVVSRDFNGANGFVRPPAIWKAGPSGLVILDCGEPAVLKLHPDEWEASFRKPSVEFQSPSVRELLTGRRRFTAGDGTVECIAERGMVSVRFVMTAIEALEMKRETQEEEALNALVERAEREKLDALEKLSRARDDFLRESLNTP